MSYNTKMHTQFISINTIIFTKIMESFLSNLLKSIAFVALSCISSISYSQDNNPQRTTFVDAEKYLWQTDSQQYRSLYNQLHFYPLQPYLDQRRLMHKIKLSDAKEIDAFLDKYEYSPLDWPLRHKWLNYLIKRNRKAMFLAAYQENRSARLNCYRMRYQLDAGMPEKTVLANVTKWWVVGKSQDKACDPLFKKWEQAGYRTQNVIWERIALAADGGKHTLLPYLTSLLDKETTYLGALWHKVRRDPAYITKLTRFPNKNKKEAQILVYGLKRLIWRAPNRALATYNKAIKSFPLTEQQITFIQEKFAIALSSKNHKSAKDWLAKIKGKSSNKALIQWQLANVLQDENWQVINKELKSFPIAVQDNVQWQYWYAKSLLKTGKHTEGNLLMNTLSDKRHYYGFLAASFLNKPINLQDKPLTFTDKEKQKVLTYPAAKRAFEFFYLGRFHDARKEWNYWLSQLGEREKLVASKVANEKQWFDRAIFTLASEGYLDDVALRFPMAFSTDIKSFSTSQKIDASWAFAIARRESSFMSDAHSSAGAKGLMQLMPATARQLAKKTISKRYLLNAKNNIELGTKYLRKLLDRHDGNQILATAAYNAGPHRVKKWLKKIDSLPADIWIETIPFKETRDYVKSVLAYQKIYQHKIGKKNSSLFEDLITMKITD